MPLDIVYIRSGILSKEPTCMYYMYICTSGIDYIQEAVRNELISQIKPGCSSNSNDGSSSSSSSSSSGSSSSISSSSSRSSSSSSSSISSSSSSSHGIGSLSGSNK